MPERAKQGGIPHLDASAWDVIIAPVSGGKDSQAVLSLALETPGVREKLVCVHQFTGYDHSLTIAHLDYMCEVYGVELQHTRHHQFTDVFDLIRKEHYFPSSVARSCTSRLKIAPFARWLWENHYEQKRTVVLMGMRGGESRNRAQRYEGTDAEDMWSICDISNEYRKRLKAIKVNLPIVHLTTGQVFDYIRSTGVKVNPLYAKGHKRVGCYPCLLANNAEWVLASRDEEGRANIRKLIEIEDGFKAEVNQKYKLIKIHPSRDVRALLEKKAFDPFAFDDDDDAGCALCMT